MCCTETKPLPNPSDVILDGVTASWRSLLESLAASAWDRVIVIGAPDRGKSSFCSALLRLLQAQNIKASLLDTALAEKCVGPPACLTLGHLEAEAYVLDDLYFAGGLHATKRMGTIIAGAARLASRGQGRLVIDTSGTVSAPGRVLKSLKIDALRPDHIVAIGLDEELEPLLVLKPQTRVHRLPSAEGAQPRNAMSRGLLRLQAFQTALADAQTYELQNLVVEPWDEDAFDWTQGEYICGLADKDGEELGIGILRSADAARSTFEVSAAVAPDRIHRIRVGMFLPDELKD